MFSNPRIPGFTTAPASRRHTRAMLLGLALLLQVPQVRAALRVVESTPSRLVVEWELTGLDIGQVLEDGRTYSTISFEGQNTDFGTPGEPLPSALGFHVGVPATGAVAVSFVAQETRSLALSNPPRLRKGRTSEPGPEFSDPWISHPEYRIFRNVRAARLVLRPVVYDAGARSARLVVRGTCTVVFPPAAAQGGIAATGSPYQASLKRVLLNYDVAQRWSTPRRALAKRALSSSPVRGAALSFTIGDGHGGTNQSTIRENGIVRIYGRDLPAGLGSSLPVNRIAVYASNKEPLSPTVPDGASIPTGVTEIPAIRVDDNKNGTFDPDDYLLVYVTGSADWSYQAGSPTGEFVFNLNNYDGDRYYWVALKNDGVGRTARSFTPPEAGGADTVTSFMNRIALSRPGALPTMLGDDGNLHPWDGGVERIWQRLSAKSPEFSYQVDYRGAQTTDSAFMRIKGDPNPADKDLITVRVNDVPLCTTALSSQQWYYVNLQKAGETPTVALSCRTTSNTRYYDLKQIELSYRQPLSFQDPAGMTIFSSPDTGIVVYRLTGLPSAQPYFVLRISADETDIAVIPNSGGSTLSWADSGGIGVRYFVCSAPGLQPLPGNAVLAGPASNSGSVIRDLWEPNRSNYLIVTAKPFLSAAQALADHKRRHGTFSAPAPAIVLIDDVYRLFSGGSRDPGALRNFLSYAFQIWDGSLDYVLLMGNGHFDYRGVGSNEPLFIPTAQVDTDRQQKCVEDFFACLKPGDTYNGIPDIMLGRLPCLTLEAANAMVEKIREMEDPARADFGAWRNRALLVADDDRQGNAPDAIAHHPSSDRVERVINAASPSAEIRKVYLFEYPWDELNEKPGASRAIINEINNGVAYVNYFGHGSDVLWADEHILTLDNLSGFRNRPRYPLISSFSCSVGRFDAPGQSSLSDGLVASGASGAIAAVSSTRIAFAGSNENLAVSFYGAAFDSSQAKSLGQAYWEAMKANGGSSNKAYCLLGDPSIILANSTHRIDLNIVRSNGEPSDTLMALERIAVRGTIGLHGPAGILSRDESFGREKPAYIQIAILNPSDSSQRKDGGTAAVSYTLPGPPIFVGRTAVNNGAFEQNLLLPRNVSFGRTGARVIAYAWQESAVAIGSKSGFVFKGTKPTSVDDSTGPGITIRPVYHDLRRNSGAALADGISGALPLEIEIELVDESGINIVGVAPDEGLTVEIPGAMRRTNLNHLFQFREGDFRTGKANLAFAKGELDSGRHVMTVTSQDLLGNTATRSFRIEITGEAVLRLGPVYNFPNPVRYGETTRFFFYTTSPTYPWVTEQVRATIMIYTLSGKPVRVLRNAVNGLVWDCTDQRGRPLSPNVYLYRVQAENPRDPLQNEKSSIKKLVIKPPRR